MAKTELFGYSLESSCTDERVDKVIEIITNPQPHLEAVAKKEINSRKIDENRAVEDERIAAQAAIEVANSGLVTEAVALSKAAEHNPNTTFRIARYALKQSTALYSDSDQPIFYNPTEAVHEAQRLSLLETAHETYINSIETVELVEPDFHPLPEVVSQQKEETYTPYRELVPGQLTPIITPWGDD